jgi:hypothetical protein
VAGLVHADDLGVLLQAEVGLEPAGYDVAVVLPPRGLAGPTDQGEQCLPFRLIGDSVEGEEVRHVTGLVADAPVLQTADLGIGAADRVGGPLAVNLLTLPQLPEPGAEHDTEQLRAGVDKLRRRGFQVSVGTAGRAGHGFLPMAPSG